MTNVFPVLLFVRGAIVLALALLAVRLARRASASLRYTILAAALVAVLGLPVIEHLVPAWHAGTLAADDPVLVTAPVAPVPETAGPALAATPLSVQPATASAPIPWRAIATGVWLAGVAACVLRIAVGTWRARRIVRRAIPADGAHEHVAAAWHALGGRGAPPAVLASGDVEGPIVVGAIAPVVVVPRAAARWSAERWRVVLLHELAHVRRHDGLANLVAQLACSLHWIDPLAWLAARRLRDERELAADDAVLRGGARATTYAEHLLAIAAAARHEAVGAALAMASSSRFEARVVALLADDRARAPAGTWRAVAVATAVGLVAAVTACVSPDAPAAPPTVASGGPPAQTTIAAGDPTLQATAEAELDRALATHHGRGAVAIVLDAKSGATLALAARGDADPNAARSPGSTLKPFTFAAALEAGVVDPSTRLDCANGSRSYGGRTLVDASPHGVLDLGGILAVSSNVCTAKLAELLGDRFAPSLRRYHFAAPAQLDARSFEAAALSVGEGIGVPALDLASAYTAIADGGVYHRRDGASERVMSESAARTVLALLERPVTDPDGTARAARIEGVRVAGKTGTVHSTGGGYYASFVGIVPADAPRFIVLVGVDGVDGQGGKVAAPVFAKIAARALAP